MVERQAGGYRADPEFVSVAVGEFLAPTVALLYVEVAVSVAADRARPEPAVAGAVHLRLEPLSRIRKPRPLIPALHALKHTTDYTEHVGRALLAQLAEVAA